MTSQLVVGAWVSPVVLAVLAARVATGDAGVPMLLATVVCAPLLALLLAQRQAQHPSGWAVTIDSRAPGLAPARSSVVLRSGVVLSGVAIFVGLVLVLAANLIVVGDLARLLGLTRVHGVGAGTVVAVAVIAWPAGDRWWRLAMPIGAGLVLLPLALVVASTQSPRATWSTMAMRPALAFDARSAWVTEGRAVGERLTLTFDEPHRVVAPAPATWRVVESDTARVSIREWRLAAGDALTLRGRSARPGRGHTRSLRSGAARAGRTDLGSGVGGRRSPSDARDARGLHRPGDHARGWGLGARPAAALPVSRVAAIIAPIGLSAFVVGASLWGLYGIAVVPELALTPRALAPPLEVVARITASPWRQGMITLLVVGVVGLLVGAMLAWRMRFAEQVREIGVTARGLSAVPVAVSAVAIAAALAMGNGDPWRLFTWGLGIVATTVAAPRLAAVGARGELFGALAGVIAFAAAVFFGGRFAEHPALMAAPLAWAVATPPARRSSTPRSAHPRSAPPRSRTHTQHTHALSTPTLSTPNAQHTHAQHTRAQHTHAQHTRA